MSQYFLTFFLFVLLSLLSCQKKVYYSKKASHWKDSVQPDSSLLDYSIYLIGDAGDPELDKEEPTFRILRAQIEKDSNSSIVFLGDNIYDYGLPSEKANDRQRSEKKLDAQLEILKNYKGKIFFISGNHDWEKSKAGGLGAVRRQEDYLEQKLNRGNTFVPGDGCPGPYRAIVHKDIIIIALDSQWWLHDHSKPYGNGSSCSAEDEPEVLTQLQDFINSNKNKNIVVVAHHPLYSNGNHGGYYSFMDYLFPLRLVKKYLYIPLPFLGALYPLHRKFGGTAQDIAHYKYQRYKKAILTAANDHKFLIYAAGHDHNLQYHEADSLYHIVSGAGSKLNPVRKGNGATFVKHSKGFSKLKYFKNTEVWVEYWTPDPSNKDSAQLSFSYKVYQKKSDLPDLTCGLSNNDYRDSSIVVAASKKYKRTKIGRAILGEHYRDEWITPVKVPFFDLKSEKGGLIPYAVGGGKQSMSLKLKDTADHQFTLRSVRKDPTKAVPEDFRNTFLHDLVKDQVSAQNPYGALAVPPLADGAKVYHTNPRLVVIPNDSCLGPYREQFKNMMSIFEEDPDENQENVASLGFAKEIVGTEKVFSELEEDHDNKVDEENFLRTRIFDMLIGDWDRHEKQYRWIKADKKKGKLYKAVPEDRDQVFFNFDGLLPWVASRKWAVRNLQDFDYKFKDIAGLNQSAKKIDRRFLNQLSRETWSKIAEDIKKGVTDEHINKAVQQFPEEVRKIHGEEIASKLRSRRERLQEAVLDYYEILSRYVDVYGSRKNEKFLIERINKNQVSVTLLDIDKEGRTQDTLYKRIFDRKITKELRIYGMGGNDIFLVSGKVKKSILVRIIGGPEKDSITDISKVYGLSKKTIVYDSKKGNEYRPSSETNAELSNAPDIHDINKDNFHYNSLAPQLTFNYNNDDGLFIGGGILYRRYKFRRSPYSVQHRLLLSVATFTGSKKIDYTGDIKKVLPGIDLFMTIKGYAPAYVMNYFGYGNESKFPMGEHSIEYYRVLLNQLTIHPALTKDLTRFFKVGIGPKYEMFEVERRDNTFLNDIYDGNSSIYQMNQYLGFRTFFNIGAVDNYINPTRGIVLTGEYNWYRKLYATSSYSQSISEFIFYITPNIPFQLTFAGRVGGGINTGTYEFYQGNTLGSGTMLGTSQNLRGFRKTRFIGDKSLYQNAEVRLELMKFNFYLFPGTFGILGLVDNGRVWAKNENSQTWHSSVGVGPWVNIFNRFIFMGTYTTSKEENLFNFKLGFSF